MRRSGSAHLTMAAAQEKATMTVWHACHHTSPCHPSSRASEHHQADRLQHHITQPEPIAQSSTTPPHQPSSATKPIIIHPPSPARTPTIAIARPLRPVAGCLAARWRPCSPNPGPSSIHRMRSDDGGVVVSGVRPHAPGNAAHAPLRAWTDACGDQSGMASSGRSGWG